MASFSSKSGILYISRVLLYTQKCLLHTRPLLPTFNFNNLCSKIRFKDSKQDLPFLSHLFICRILFIEAYKPTISHYRSAHAPLRRYLPFEITIQSMYEDFKIKTESNISYLTFYTIFKKMNISLAHLGHEECELCETHELHKKKLYLCHLV